MGHAHRRHEIDCRALLDRVLRLDSSYRQAMSVRYLMSTMRMKAMLKVNLMKGTLNPKVGWLNRWQRRNWDQQRRHCFLMKHDMMSSLGDYFVVVVINLK